MGMTRFEREVIELWDRGFAIGKIAVQLGIKPVRVNVVIANFGRTDESRIERSMMTAGSAALAAALSSAGHCP